MRKSNALFGQQLSECLKKDAFTLQSEKLPAFLPFYVDRNLINQIHNISNQLIVGRRGTGKTHLLGAFNEFIEENRELTEVSVYISLLDLNSSPIPEAHDSPSFRAKRLAQQKFKEFLNLFFDEFLIKVSSRLRCIEKNSHLDRMTKDKIIRETNDYLYKLLEEMELGTYVPKDNRVQKEIIKIHSKHAKNKNKKLGIEANNFLPKLSLGFGFGDNDAEELEHSVSIENESPVSINLVKVKRLIIKILELTRIDCLYLLIDEWMELEKGSRSKIQPIFAQLLKKVFLNNNRIAVKISSVWHQTTLYDKEALEKAQGIQLGHDIEIGADLDIAFLTEEEEILSFCKELIFRRLVKVCPDLQAFEKNGEIDDEFITELFDNRNNFRAFITATHGIPRDIMNVLYKSVVRIKNDFKTHCIDYEVVAYISKNLYNTEKRRHIDPASSVNKLLTRINRYVETHDRRLFLVKNEQAYKSDELRKLLDEEIIHQVPSSTAHRSVKDEYKVFQVDYGNYVDWIETKRSKVEKILEEFVIVKYPADFEHKFSSYIIEVSDIDTNVIKCPSCNNSCSKDAPVFQKRGLCPHCAEELITHIAKSKNL